MLIILIKTTKDDANTHYFVSFPDLTDKQVDYDVTRIFYKIWAINTGKKMMEDLK